MIFPALELVWSPTGAGSVVNGHSWPIGGTHELGPRGLTFGIEGDVRLRYPPPTEAGREICKVERRGDRLVLWQFQKRFRCAVNGRDVHETELELHHRDLITMPKGPVLRVLEAPVAHVRSPTLEAAIRANPNDRELTKVYSDFLLDHGDPLGERLAKPGAGDAATWLDVLAAHYEGSRLEIEWQHGLATRVVLRDALGKNFTTLEDVLEHLAGLPVMRFLRDLTLDVASAGLAVSDGLHALAAVALPPTVQRLSLGDVHEHHRERVTRQLDAAPGKVDVGFYRDAVIEVLACARRPDEGGFVRGAKIEIGRHLYLGETETMSLLNENVVFGGSHLVSYEGGRYVIAAIGESVELPKVNGRPADRIPLRDGDLVEIVGELTGRFTLLR
ncbi:MAG: hypothetical protein JNK82_44295 [Myxococcaceae bacterium]|nr:hypothetical protein [Myxococcaceae bacterium]